MNAIPADSDTADRVQLLLAEQQQRLYTVIDRMFGVLMLIQWVAAIAAARWVSPLTWDGLSHRTHPHVWLAIGLGGSIASFPLLLDFCFPGRTITRHVNSAAQVLFSALLIHVTGGRIETHFHVFGSLAFLACYRDWKVLIPATLIVAADHCIRGVWWPESVFGIASASYWRWLEHAGWVVFEDIFLTIACLQGVSEMRNIAARTVALEDTDRWKSSVFEAALDAVVTMDGNGRITEWNSKAEHLFGWTASEVIGRPFHETIIPPQFREQQLPGLQTCHRTRTGPVLNQRIEISALRRDGTEFPVELAITAIHRHDQLSFCGFIRDITARARAEQELRSAKEAAEAANCAKSSFLANMSHEIRTPLNGILGFTELLRRKADQGDDEKRRLFVETIERSGRHLLNVINDVLDLSKIEAGQLEVDQICCSPHEILADVVSILRVTAKEKGLSLNYFWSGEAPETIETDPGRLRQILMNLVGNAIKFTEHGSVTIDATFESEEGERSWLKFMIKDTGVGIPPDMLDAIFEPFVQGDSSVTRSYAGTGLGLSICKRLCRLLGGSIQVQSHPGIGSLFSFTVKANNPRFQASKCLVSGDTIASPSGMDLSTHNGLAGRRILLVEDGPINRKLIHFVLQDAGAKVTLAENGQEGLEEVLRNRFDAVLLDMQMPVMDGYTAAAEMRQSGVTCPIIALTAHAMSGDAEKCLEAGCSLYLSKPVDSEQLIRTLIRVSPSSSVPSKRLADASTAQQPIARESSSNAIRPSNETKFASTQDSDISRSILPVERPVYQAIVRDYVTSLSGTLDAIEVAYRNEDFDRLSELAHILKGSGGTAGFPALSAAAEQFGHALRRRESDAFPKALDQLRDTISRVMAADLTSGV